MFDITIQKITKSAHSPNDKQLKEVAEFILKNKLSSAELVIRIVDKEEMTFLNKTYRGKDKHTNVLAFPSDLPIDITPHPLGDIVICADVIKEEAIAQHKTLDSHWAHMITHGILHLMGYDHENLKDAETMETEEIYLLSKMGYSNPYESL